MSPTRNDAHFVVPSDKYVNGKRENLPFRKVQNANYTSSNGSKRGNNLNSGYSSGFTEEVFEPIDEFKGDIARMHFYFATRYEDDIVGYNSYEMFNGTKNQVFNTTFFNILYTWHTNDPVSQREIDRNNAIFTAQNNRNPFIDHPEYVQSIWNNLLSNKEIAFTEITIYPNPVKEDVLYILTKQEVNVTIYNILGKSVLKRNINSSKNRIDISLLPKGMYILKITSKTGSITKKLIKQ